MSFASALTVLRPTLPYYVALTKYGLLRITKDCFEFHPNPAAPPIALDMARAVFTMGASSCTESYVMSRTLAEGPKVFAFDALTGRDMAMPADVLLPTSQSRTATRCGQPLVGRTFFSYVVRNAKNHP